MDSPISHEQIALRAHHLWEERGRPEGRDLEHWLEAERQLRRESNQGRGRGGPGQREPDLVEAEKRLDGLTEPPPSPARRTPKGEQL
jgi:hypothetical protein